MMFHSLDISITQAMSIVARKWYPEFFSDGEWEDAFDKMRRDMVQAGEITPGPALYAV